MWAAWSFNHPCSTDFSWDSGIGHRIASTLISGTKSTSGASSFRNRDCVDAAGVLHALETTVLALEAAWSNCVPTASFRVVGRHGTSFVSGCAFATKRPPLALVATGAAALESPPPTSNTTPVCHFMARLCPAIHCGRGFRGREHSALASLAAGSSILREPTLLRCLMRPLSAPSTPQRRRRQDLMQHMSPLS